jgi:hypothetical protein
MDAEAQLDSFMAGYSPEVAADARQALGFLQARLPTAFRLVYDNYNALVIGFASGEKASDAFLSIALYPKYIRLFFLRGVELDDPGHLLEGSGAQVRSIRIKPVSRIEEPEVCALIDAAVAIAAPPLPECGDGPLIIKSISAKQRPRRPRA